MAGAIIDVTPQVSSIDTKTQDENHHHFLRRDEIYSWYLNQKEKPDYCIVVDDEGYNTTCPPHSNFEMVRCCPENGMREWDYKTIMEMVWSKNNLS